MIDLYRGLARRALFCLEAEKAHRLTIAALASGLARVPQPRPDPALRQTLFGLDFPNPLGMAAGFDKDAEVPDAVLGLGFGFTEIGTVTPLAQPGNPRPRLFRLVEDRGIINRMGFNNAGHAPALARLRARRGRPGIVGVNVGANKDAADRMADYVTGIARFAAVADYFTVNVSSPNTPGLRDLQAKAALEELLARALEARDAAAEGAGRRVPVLLKIAPDLDEHGLDDVAEAIAGSGLDGLIVSNTTISRPALASPRARESGGLSGRPLFPLSTIALAKMRGRVGPGLPLIGVGGVDSAETAFAKIAAGANLVQLYSGLVYEGPDLIGRILGGLSAELKRRGLASLADASGCEAEAWAARQA
ncbi:quinone-dependent dihydroorotate dehydrogenase [Pseudoxanthobacter sp.]|uniref:quinone-dependent dihydroorotate dehydrogenase n=1 Tax=Pseudoxanthobacter sp. TaxID=1925742 RepID=UPI002FE11FA5